MAPPLMKEFAVDRINIEKPALYNTGVDYFVPKIAKQYRKKRLMTGPTKCWVALFTSLTTWGVHLGLVKQFIH